MMMIGVVVMIEEGKRTMAAAALMKAMEAVTTVHVAAGLMKAMEAATVEVAEWKKAAGEEMMRVAA